ncbi:MAG: PqqD family protein [Hyphomicrobiales bacterium]
MNERIPRKILQRFVETEIDGEAVIMNLDTGHFHSLKETGLTIWRLIDGQRSVSAIQAALLDTYDVEESQCRADCERFFASLQGAGFVDGV